MYHALRAGLTLAVTIVVLKAFMPEIADGLTLAISQALNILTDALGQAQVGLPQ